MSEKIEALLTMQLAWQPQASGVVFSFLMAAALFAGFHFLTLEKNFKPWFEKQGLDQSDSILAAGVMRKLLGGLILGLGSCGSLWLLGLSPWVYAFGHLGYWHSLICILLGVLIFVPTVAFTMRNPKMWAYYPEIRCQRFTRKPACWSALAWVVYLLGFEFFFRGFLLFYWAQHFGVWPALAMTTSLYVLAHLPTNANETASTLPMGIVFGAMAIDSGSFIAPFVVHACIAITSDLAAARANPAIKT